MSVASRLRRLLNRSAPSVRVGERRPSTTPRRRDDLHEDALRAVLADNPNNQEAFESLATIVRRRAAETAEGDDPLIADVPESEAQRAADLAVWSLAEELAGSPKAWYPLIELARLSWRDDPDAALRRLATAAERDSTGRALAEGLAVLREADLQAEALGLGTGHWRPREHDPEVARHLVLAALEVDRPFEARQHLDALDLHPDAEAVAALRAELEPQIARASQHITGT